MKAQIKLDLTQELFDEATIEEIRAKAKNVMRSEFDKIVKEECQKIISERLHQEKYIEITIKEQVRKAVENEFHNALIAHKSNTTLNKFISQLIESQLPKNIEKIAQLEVEKRMTQLQKELFKS